MAKIGGDFERESNTWVGNEENPGGGEVTYGEEPRVLYSGVRTEGCQTIGKQFL